MVRALRKWLAALTVLGGVFAAPSALAQDAEIAAPAETVLFGDWLGELALPGGRTLRLMLRFRSTDEGVEATLDSLDQGALGIPAVVESFAPDALAVSVPSVGARYDAVLEDGALVGVFAQGVEFPLTMERASAEEAALDRPQEAAMTRDYVVETVAIPGGADGVTLAGELTRPHGEGPFPGVVLISGSGPQDRDEALAGHRPFLILSDYLTQRGYAVLRYDDRGVGDSTGDFATATTLDFAADAAAAFAWLTERTIVDAARSGYAGHSEGGLVAPIAAETTAPAFLVLLAAPSVPLAEVLIRQGRDIALATLGDAATPEALARQEEVQRGALTAIADAATPDDARAAMREALEGYGMSGEALEAELDQNATPWLHFLVDYDPAPALAAFDGPALAAFGGRDMQVAVDVNAPPAQAALSHPGSAVQVFDGLNHLFQPAQTGSPTEYADIAITFDPDALRFIADWMDEATASGQE